MTTEALAIALVLDSRNYGGIETHVANLAKGLHKSGHHIHIVLLNNYGEHPVFDSDAFLSTILVKLDGKLSALYTFLNNSNIDLVHTHGYKAGIIGRISCKLLNRAVVSTFHSGEKGNAKIRFYRWLDNITVQSSPCICVSQQIKKSAKLTAEVIVNFIELPPKIYTAVPATQIAFVGRLSYEKGPDLFLRFAKQLPQFSFAMYGDGPMLKEISANATTNVRIMGHIKAMEQHWENIKFLCITSREEGLPLVAIEALVRGIPVISFDIGGLAAVVINEVNGWLIPPFNEALFIDAIKQGHMLSSKQRKAMSSSAYQHIKNNFSSAAIITQIANVYRMALKGGSHAK